jgi:DNA invertase Pin-like site-specific DNA recombinase
VVAYLRVSGKQQTVENQRPALEALAARLGLAVDEWREEQQSAVKVRPVWDGLMHDARRGRVGTMLVWALDRVGRSLIDTFVTIAELDGLGVRVVSHQEAWLDTRGPTRGLLLAIFSWVAEQERARLVERTLAGLERARAEGKVLGRPSGLSPEQVAAARVLRAQGASWSKVAAAIGVPPSTVRSALARNGGSILAGRPVEDGTAAAGMRETVDCRGGGTP